MYLKIWERDQKQADTGQESSFVKQLQKVKLVTTAAFLPKGPLQFARIWQKATDLNGFSYQRKTWCL